MFLKPKQLIQTLALTVIAAAGFAGCDQSGGGYYDDPYIGGPGPGPSDPGYDAWYDTFGNVCGSNPGPGCNYFRSGTKIKDFQDPYYYTDYDWYAYYDSYYDHYAKVYKSPSGIIYNQYGQALNSQGKAQDLDILSATAEDIDAKIKEVGQSLASRFQLSDEKAIDIATQLHDWSQLGKTRARTQQDIQKFTKKLYGVDMNQIKDAMKNKDLKKGETLLNTAAKTWGTSPAQMREVLKSFYGKK
jgi:hypothetical protein